MILDISKTSSDKHKPIHIIYHINTLIHNILLYQEKVVYWYVAEDVSAYMNCNNMSEILFQEDKVVKIGIKITKNHLKQSNVIAVQRNS